MCQYEHIDPEFADAQSHDPNAITLLCGRCHDKVTRGLLSKSSVRAANETPQAVKEGFSFDSFDIGFVHPTIQIGPLKAVRPQTLIRVFGDPVLRISEPELPGGPFRISATFTNRNGAEVFRITNNVWETPINNWDVEVVGPQITLRAGRGDLVFQVRVNPPEGLIVERLEMFYRGTHIYANQREFGIQGPNGQTFQTAPLVLTDCETVVSLDHKEMMVGVGCSTDVFIEHLVIGHRPIGERMRTPRQIE